jgi:serine/threonine protein kinase
MDTSLRARVGQGSFGQVFKAVTSAGEVFAIKMLSKIDNNEKKEVAYKEFELLRRCAHPNLLRLMQVYRIETLPDAFFMVTDPWAPDTLLDFIDQSNVDRASNFPWYRQGSADSEKYCFIVLLGLANGLHHLHITGIKHKDIKPSNILIYRDDLADPKKQSNPWHVRPIIADLGISKLVVSGGTTNFTNSTYQYLAPEQVAHKDSSPKSDVFSMGCCFANIIAVLCRGSEGRELIKEAFMDFNRSCRYATELPHVFKALDTIHANYASRRKLLLTSVRAMLSEDPKDRPDSHMVTLELERIQQDGSETSWKG